MKPWTSCHPHWQRLCLQVIKLISQVIADFANGEISQVKGSAWQSVVLQGSYDISAPQASSLFDTEVTLEQYLDKSFYKTASLIAASCRSAAVFSDTPTEVKVHRRWLLGDMTSFLMDNYDLMLSLS